MYQDIEEPVEVIVLFETGPAPAHAGRMLPIKFRWKGRAIKIKQVTSSWKSDVGEHKIRYFAVLDSASNFFQLAYDERNTAWVLNKIWVE
jgi:hypothetical protein